MAAPFQSHLHSHFMHVTFAADHHPAFPHLIEPSHDTIHRGGIKIHPAAHRHIILTTEYTAFEPDESPDVGHSFHARQELNPTVSSKREVIAS